MLSIWLWAQLGVVYNELLKPTETITGDRCRTQLMRLSRALKDKWPQCNERRDKVILQHDTARPYVAKIASKDDQFFQHGIRTLPERWEKVVASDGQYFES
ncbi:Mariner Mos1 transposase [Eumeta japonica]|uniref:Mariner Mos1 transposase n=1 Tax=Eumeta variegata TaxID=151549 RepID=A0A4C1VHZ7_EUMVA|nr:Mariner Mos1 transposase [Eumeta japonica]